MTYFSNNFALCLIESLLSVIMMVFANIVCEIIVYN